MQRHIRYSEAGIFIPAEWLKDMGTDVSVQKSGHVIIIETRQRKIARSQLQDMVQRLRQTGRQLEPIPDEELVNIVDEVSSQYNNVKRSSRRGVE